MATNDNDAAVLYYNLGYDSLINGRHDEAVEQLTLAINENDHSAEAYFARGVCYHLLGKYDLAYGDITNASRLHSKEADIYLKHFELTEYKKIIKRKAWVNNIDSARFIYSERDFMSEFFYELLLL